MKKIIPFLVTLLSGCTSMNNKYDCPLTHGVMCKNLDEVNAMVDNGQLGHTSTRARDKSSTKNPEVNYHAAIDPLTPRRQPEEVMRIWIAPFEDAKGNYHQDNVIFTVIKPSTWSTPL